MQLTCPCCAARFALEAALGDVAAREAVAAAARLPAPLGDLRDAINNRMHAIRGCEYRIAELQAEAGIKREAA